MKKIIYLSLVVFLFPVSLFAGSYISDSTEATLLKFPQKTLVGIIRCIVDNGGSFNECLVKANPIILTNNDFIAVDINGAVDLTGTGFAPKGNIITLYSGTFPNTVIRGPILIDSNTAKTLVSVPVSGVKGLNLTSADISNYFSGGQNLRLHIKRPDSDAAADVYITVSEDLVADKISIVAQPDLARTYNTTTKVESLTSTFKIALRSEKKSAVTIAKTGAFNFQSFGTLSDFGQVVSNNQIETTYGKPTGAGVVDYGNYYIIKENSVATFTVKAELNALVLFAGRYQARLASVKFGDQNGSNVAFQPISTGAKFNKTDAVTVIGEASPYISSAQFTTVSGREVFVISGVRFAAGQSIYIGSLRIGTSTGTSKVAITIPLSEAQISQQIANAGVQSGGSDSGKGFYFLTVKDSKNGESNNFGISIKYSTPVLIDETSNASSCPFLLEKLSYSSSMLIGSYGSSVHIVKCFLNRIGLLSGNYLNDYFGDKTNSAVIAYKTSKGIVPVNGKVEAVTIASIGNDTDKINASVFATTTTPISTTTKVCPVGFTCN